MPSEIVCSFCQARRPFMDPENPIPVIPHADFTFYRCPCWAVAAPAGSDPLCAGWDLDSLVSTLCSGILRSEPGACHARLNYITQTDPPLPLVWAKRREPPFA